MSDEVTEIPQTGEPPKKKKAKWKYLVSILIVVVLTVVSIVLSLLSAGDGSVAEGAKITWNALATANVWWVIGLLALVFGIHGIGALIIWFFGRMYTRSYHYGKALGNEFVGAFYSAVTPSASGGQVMQVLTMKKQGVPVSNAASIFVMWFILYQINLIVFDIVAIIVEWSKIVSLSSFSFKIGNANITLLPLMIIGFLLNVGILGLLFLMSYSHRIHNFIMHRVVNLGAKMRLIKNPDKARENLRVQIENFKIELRRLLTNIPAALLISVLFMIMLFVRFSLPYFSAAAFDAVGDISFLQMMHTAFLSSFHEMTTGLFPIPGAAGIAEALFQPMFRDIIGPTFGEGGVVIREAAANMAISQILWRAATFHIVVIVSGIIASVYKGRPSKDFEYANRKEFLTIQMETMEMRKLSVDTLYETRQLSRKEIRKRVKSSSSKPDNKEADKLVRKIEKKKGKGGKE